MKKIIVALATCLVLASCHTLAADLKAVGTDALDCTKAEVLPAVVEFTPTVIQLIKDATGADGTINWPQVEQGTLNLLNADGECTVASGLVSVEQGLVADSAPMPASAPAAKAPVTESTNLVGARAFRAKHLPKSVKLKFQGKIVNI